MGRPPSKRFALLPGAVPPKGGADVPLVAMLLSDYSKHPRQDEVGQAIRTSSIVVKLGRSLGFDPVDVDRLHLWALARLDLIEHRTAWSKSGSQLLRWVAGVETERSHLVVLEWTLYAQHLVRQEGLFHGFETLSKCRIPEPLSTALFDLRFDEAYWNRVDSSPTLECLVSSGESGLSSVEIDQLPHLTFEQAKILLERLARRHAA